MKFRLPGLQDTKVLLVLFFSILLIIIFVVASNASKDNFEIIETDKNTVKLGDDNNENISLFDKSKYFQYMTALEDSNLENKLDMSRKY
jgi:hypothetical protein